MKKLKPVLGPQAQREERHAHPQRSGRETPAGVRGLSPRNARTKATTNTTVRGGLRVDTFSCLARRVRCARLCSCIVGASVRCARLCSFFVEAGALGSCVGQCAQALCFFPKTQLLALSYRPKRRRFSVLSVFISDFGDFCAPCAVLCPFRAPGVPEQNQRRRRLAHQERRLRPTSVQRQTD